MKSFPALVFFCGLLGLFTPLKATHIVGGQMTYTHVEDDTYRVSCEVIRDCFWGDPSVYFDAPAYFGLFDANNLLVETFIVDFSGIDDTLTNGIVGDVCVYDAAVCFHSTVYEFEVILPSSENYTVAYQRCCRSTLLSNIIDPLATGLTLQVNINPDLQNNSAEFETNFPTIVYGGTPFIFDGAGFDTDGDSLVYALHTPFSGATNSIPQPIPVNPPPYDTISYFSGYGLGNMLGGSYPLQIDPATGELSAIPTILGVFQIGYQIKEYRDGVHINTVYRDFVFNVVPPQTDLVFNISGQVLVDGQTVLDAGRVELLERDVQTDSLSLLRTDTIISATDGAYAFTNILPGVTYLKAAPATTSEYFDTHLPTYLGDTPFWYEAEIVNQCDTNQENRDIQLIPLVETEGNLTAEITLMSDNGNLSPVVDLQLIAFDLNGQAVGSAKTNEDGVVNFTNLEPAVYLLKIDSLNSPYLNEIDVAMDLTLGLIFTGVLNDSTIELSVVSNLTNEGQSETNQLRLFPNPTTGVLNIQRQNSDGGFRAITVYNANGQKLREQVVDETSSLIQIDLREQSNGLYFISILNAAGQLELQRVMLQR